MKNLEPIIEAAEKRCGLTALVEIYRGTYYAADQIRNMVFRCQYQDKTAILKVYDDPRETFEPQALADFHLHNTSKIIRAPQLYDSKTIDSRRGWLLMEEIPKGAKTYDYLMSPADREEFLRIFQEYRQNFPIMPTRELMLVENLNSADFHVFRINRWLELANRGDYDQFLATGQHITDPVKLADLVEKTIDAIQLEFTNRQMIWCHGHFKHHEVYKVDEKNYFLIDFAHSKMYPEGYELAFIIWADYLMAPDNWKWDSKKWQSGAQEWLNLAIQTAKAMGTQSPEKLLRAALLERTIGTILADVMGSDKPLEEKIGRLQHLFTLAESLK
jgi:hypothetical protein